MNPLDRVQRESLLRGAVLAGNEDAWQTWYEETYDPLYRYVQWRCGGRRDWADEIVQETWLVAVRSIRRFDPKKACFLAWMRGIAANVLRNDLRRRRRSPKFEQSADGQLGNIGTIASPSDDGRQEHQIAAALDALAEREEAVLRAKYLEGMSVAEIASARGETPKAIESLLSRARQAFREVYQGQFPCSRHTPCAVTDGAALISQSADGTRSVPATFRPMNGEGG
jgi:RNA polymerase sigma-70 factor, ECF subfamily